MTALHSRPLILALALVAAMLLAPAAARAQDDFLSRANALYSETRQEKRSDLVLLPVIAKMDAPPAAVADFADAILLPATSASWGEVAAWANAPAQRAVLEALATVTADEGPTTHMVFAQPYGYEGVPVDLVMAELYTELGDPPTLAAAEFFYLNGLDKARSLAHVEANRLMAEGKGVEAMKVMVDWLAFARQIADRELAKEKAWGVASMGLALEHIRDLAYQDFQASTRSLTPAALTDIVRRLEERRAAVGIDRILLPRADRFAVEQLLFRIYDQNTRKPNQSTYATVMADLASSDRPLRLFSEAARWEQLRPQAADWYKISDALRDVANDFERRWGLAFRDPVNAIATDFDRTVKGKPGFAPIAVAYDIYPKFFKVRQDLRVEAGGTRMSLAMYAYYLQHRQFPLAITAVRPAFAQTVDKDPYNPLDRDLVFFVPIRDQPRGERGETQPHEIRVFPGSRFPNFSVRLRDDQFVLYSVGPDEERGWARDATQAQEGYRVGDYLLWPPSSSLLRQHLTQIGRLK